VSLISTSIDGSVKFFGDGGDDSFDFTDSTLGDFKLLGSDGTLAMTATNVVFDKNCVVTGGPQADSITWTRLDVDGQTIISLSQGDDEVHFDSVALDDDVGIRLSNGNNTLTMVNSQLGEKFKYSGAVDNDVLAITDTSIGEQALITLGPGTNSL